MDGDLQMLGKDLCAKINLGRLACRGDFYANVGHLHH
jgi:hypothetical protein